jgi:type II secretory pathway predicted ATPase ExeA/peptidoglycan hydrolase-like protein with peptidoglycan-binding domain
MYESFFGLRESPFSLVPDPEYLYLSRFHRKGLNMLELALRDSAMFTLISGEVGSGKTTLVRKFLEMLDDNVSIGLITNTHESAGNLTQWILRSFGLRYGKDDEVALYDRFQEFLVDQYVANRKTMLIIDEAQNLSPAALEELRMLSNINTEKDLALQIVFVGQPEILEKINMPQLRQLAQRISVNFRLEPLSFLETCHYIRHRLMVAGGRPETFDLDACATVYIFSDGIPRVINMICEMAMIYAYGEGRQEISSETILDVVEERRRSGIGGMSALTKDFDRAEIEVRIRELIDQGAPALAASHGTPGEPTRTTSVPGEAGDVPPPSGPKLGQPTDEATPYSTSHAPSLSAQDKSHLHAAEDPEAGQRSALGDEFAPMQASVIRAPHLKPIFAGNEPEQAPEPEPKPVDHQPKEPRRKRRFLAFALVIAVIAVLVVYSQKLINYNQLEEQVQSMMGEGAEESIQPSPEPEPDLGSADASREADEVEPDQWTRGDAAPSGDDAVANGEALDLANSPSPSSDDRDIAEDWVKIDGPADNQSPGQEVQTTPVSATESPPGEMEPSPADVGAMTRQAALEPEPALEMTPEPSALDETPAPELAPEAMPQPEPVTLPDPQTRLTPATAPKPKTGELTDIFARYTDRGTLELALSSLFRTWGFDYRNLPGNAPCEKAQTRGLACVEGQGDWNTLYRFNKPTLLRLLSERNTVLYVVMSGLSEDTVDLTVGETTYRISRRDLDEVWNGSYLILRRNELPFNRTLVVGTRGADVDWLRHSLSEIYSLDLPQGGRYDSELRRLVTRFQRDQELRQDGIFGPRTHSRLIEVIRDLDSPLLVDDGTRQG